TRFEISRTAANSTRARTLMYSAIRLNPAFRRASRPFLPTGITESLRPLLARKNSFALRKILVLNAPARPRSPVKTSVRAFSSGRRASSGCCGSATRLIVERSTRTSSLAYGRAAKAASCARRKRAAATNFMARVICWVFFTERMRRRKSRSVGMALRQSRSLIGGRRRRYREAFLEGIDGFLDFRIDAVIERLLRRNILQQ